MSGIRHYTTKSIKLSDLKDIAKGKGLHIVHFRDDCKTYLQPDFIRRLEYFLAPVKCLKILKSFLWVPGNLPHAHCEMTKVDENVGAFVVDHFDGLLYPTFQDRIEELRDILLNWASQLHCPIVVIHRFTL